MKWLKPAQIEAAETAIDHSLARAAHLRQSILKRASLQANSSPKTPRTNLPALC